MRRCVSPVLLLSGCVLSFSLCPFPVMGRFHVDDRKMTWSEAKRTCRLTFRDLVTITDLQTMTDLQTIKDLQKITDQTFWIGLFRSAWKWSHDEAYDSRLFEKVWTKGVGELWCVLMNHRGEWISRNCNDTNFFFCYDESSQNHVLVRKKKTWMAALNYCKNTYTRISGIFSLKTNNKLKNLLTNSQEAESNEEESVVAWFGLSNNGWMWSNGSDAPYRRWGVGQPLDKHCVMMDMESKTWFTSVCSEKRGFICYSDDQSYSLKTVKLSFKTSADVSDAAVQSAILHQVKRVLSERGVANMRWIRKYPKEEETAPPADDPCGTA
ncbi:lymphocyte antigen 75-like isoform X2 [Gouania willdenowi]|nr:lymphocyte antigen 75-like isoform X2 [Gouania willdenowi]